MPRRGVAILPDMAPPPPSSKSKSGKSKSKKSKRKLPADRTAAGADRYELYGESVQDAGHEVEFFDRVYRDRHGKKAKPQVLREDFCGTFAVCCNWVTRGKDRQALGVDLDPEPLAWGIRNNLDRVTDEQRSRVTLLQQDVRKVNSPKADVLAAQNFSFFIFKTRKEVLDYFKKARKNLAPGGIMVIDMMGGPECFTEDQRDVRKIGKGKRSFKYIWETERVDPVTHDCLMHISFRFKDGTSLDKAFTYDWRFWTMPEVRELLAEAGFEKSIVYWENEDEDGDNAGEFEPVKDGDPVKMDPAYVAYVVAWGSE